MKTRTLFLLSMSMVLALGCHGQLPPTAPYNTVWTWTAPASGSTWPGCTTAAPCTFVVSTLAVPSGTASCPASTGSNYAPQQTVTTGVSATTFTQTGTSGETLCAVVQTVQSGNVSAASTPSSPVASPALPLAPNAPSGATQVSEVQMPLPAPSPQLAKAEPIKLTGIVTRY